MTRLFHAGAETGHDHADGLTTGGTGTMTYDTGTKRTGTRSWKFDATASNLAIYRSWVFTGTLGLDYFGCVYVYFPSASGMPSAATTRIALGRTGSTSLCSARITSGGKLQLWNEVSAAQIGSDSAATLTTDTWYRIELRFRTNTGSVDEAELYLDGVQVAVGTGLALSEAAPTNFLWGWFTTPGASKIMYADDVAVNDSNGSVNNSWVGAHNVYLLLPISDSARDAGWVAGAGGTTNLWEAVNNIPPAGLDSGAATNTSQVENAVSTTTEEYDANMTDYTTAGVGANDAVTAVYAVIEGGNSATTGTDTVGVSVESNPVIAETTPSIDVNDGTYPTGWLRGATGIVENPSVTKGTSPVMSLRKNVATTRVNTVCFMGMYVDAAPGVPAAPPRPARVLAVPAPYRAIGD